jgi:two-component system, NarL family, nitrate/nitrite response regulator NarL
MKDRALVVEPARIRIAVFETQELYRTGLCLLVSKQTGFELAGHASTWSDVLLLVHKEKPAVLLLALSAADIPMLELLPGILAGSEETKVLALLDSNDPEISKKVVRLGAVGVLTKDKPSSMLVKAIECIVAGEAWLDR